MASADHNPTTDEVLHEFLFFRVFKEGRIQLSRPDSPKIPPSDDPATGVHSKDVAISSEPPVSARIFMPRLITTDNPDKKLPALLYIHGGGFCMQSAFSPQYHGFCSAISAAASAIIVSVEYGLFPSRPLPGCYEDSWAALRWVADHAGGEGPDPWLNRHADFERVFIAGDSGGANISHTLAFRVGTIGLPWKTQVAGLILVHPFFGGTKDDEMWLYMCENNEGLEDRRLNPPLEDLEKLGCERVVVFLAEKDHLKEVGKNYGERLKKSGWRGKVEVVESENEGHRFHLVGDPKSEKAMEFMNMFVSFITQ